MLFEYIQKVRRKPPAERKVFAMAFALSITGIIVLIWLSVLVVNDGMGHYSFIDGEEAGDANGNDATGPVWENLLDETNKQHEETGLSTWEEWLRDQEMLRETTLSEEEVRATNTSTSTGNVGTTFATTSSTTTNPTDDLRKDANEALLEQATTTQATTTATGGNNPFSVDRLEQ
jgi:hypothetical protein